MRLLLAFDSFKDSLSSSQAAEAFTQGFLAIHPTAHISPVLVSDGGEGFLEAMLHTQGSRHTCPALDPLGNHISAEYGLFNQNSTAVVEMAQASGLWRVPLDQRNPMQTTSYGTGQTILAALQHQPQALILGIGGSATVDGGIGMAQALGVKFFDAQDNLLTSPLTGQDCLRIHRMDVSCLPEILKQIKVVVANDVENPLLGSNGAASVFGPQKGATPELIPQLEAGLDNVARVLTQAVGVDIRVLRSAGAAGGVGAMLHALCGADMNSGIQVLSEYLGLEEKIQQCDWLITGEGKLDAQTLHGKTIMGLLKLAKRNQKPVLAIAGSLDEPHFDALYQQGLSAAIPLVNQPMTLAEAVERAPELMELCGQRVGRMFF